MNDRREMASDIIPDKVNTKSQLTVSLDTFGYKLGGHSNGSQITNANLKTRKPNLS